MTLTVDGHEVSVPHGTTVFDAARLAGVSDPGALPPAEPDPRRRLPHLRLRRRRTRPAGRLRLQSRTRHMVVKTNTEPIKAVRDTLYELMLSDHPSPCLRQQQSNDCELETQAAAAGVIPSANRFKQRAVPVMAPGRFPPSPSTSITRPAFCATAASAAVPRSATTT